MIFDLLAPSPGPQGRGQKQFDVARPIYVSNLRTKFGWISSNGLWGDSIKERRTDRRRRLQYLLAFLKKRGDNYTKCLYIHLHWQHLYWDCYLPVMALNCRLYFVSAQHLQNTCTELGEILHILWYRQAVIVACQFSPTFNLWPLSDAGQNSVSTRYRENKGMGFCPIFIYVFILARSWMEFYRSVYINL